MTVFLNGVSTSAKISATTPTIQAHSDSAVVGADGDAADALHKHGMPAEANVTFAAIADDVRNNKAILCFVFAATATGSSGDIPGGLTIKSDGTGDIQATGFISGNVFLIRTGSGADSQSLVRTHSTVTRESANPEFSVVLKSDAGGAELTAQGWGFNQENTVPTFMTTSVHKAIFRSVTTGVLFAVSGNASSEETTDLSSFHTLGQKGTFTLKTIDGGTNWLFYIDGVLRATHNTQVPGNFMYVVVGIENNTTIDVRINEVDFIVATADRS